MEIYYAELGTPSHRPIDAAPTRMREQLAVITVVDREAIETATRDISAALRLALLASELRREMTAEVALRADKQGGCERRSGWNVPGSAEGWA